MTSLILAEPPGRVQHQNRAVLPALCASMISPTLSRLGLDIVSEYLIHVRIERSIYRAGIGRLFTLHPLACRCFFRRCCRIFFQSNTISYLPFTPLHVGVSFADVAGFFFNLIQLVQGFELRGHIACLYRYRLAHTIDCPSISRTQYLSIPIPFPHNRCPYILLPFVGATTTEVSFSSRMGRWCTTSFQIIRKKIFTMPQRTMERTSCHHTMLCL